MKRFNFIIQIVILSIFSLVVIVLFLTLYSSVKVGPCFETSQKQKEDLTDVKAHPSTNLQKNVGQKNVKNFSQIIPTKKKAENSKTQNFQYQGPVSQNISGLEESRKEKFPSFNPDNTEMQLCVGDICLTFSNPQELLRFMCGHPSELAQKRVEFLQQFLHHYPEGQESLNAKTKLAALLTYELKDKDPANITEGRAILQNLIKDYPDNPALSDWYRLLGDTSESPDEALILYNTAEQNLKQDSPKWLNMLLKVRQGQCQEKLGFTNEPLVIKNQILEQYKEDFKSNKLDQDARRIYLETFLGVKQGEVDYEEHNKKSGEN